jgi:phosphate transport system substrate-binding protein
VDSIPWEVTLAVLGVVVPIVAALWEFVFFGRKRLGYRVQMDTTATDEVHPPETEEWQELWPGLTDPSLILLRIENNGITDIDSSDYQVLEHQRVALRFTFPGRQVHRMVVTDPSDEGLLLNFEGEDSGLKHEDDKIELPRVPLNRGQHYKVLAVLDCAGEEPARPYAKPKPKGGIKRGVGRGRIRETHSRSTDLSWRSAAMIGFLVLVAIGQFLVWLTDEDSTSPLDCAENGTLTVTGSTAFEPVLREAAASYTDTCPGNSIAIETRGSSEGLDRLGQAARPDVVAFTDGAKREGYPQLLPRPIAFSLFTLVINGEAGVADLTLDQIRRIYDGTYTNWQEVGGNDVPIRLVSRHSDSGTRRTFEQQILGGTREPGDNSDDCLEVAEGGEPGVVRCQRDSTSDVLTAVAETPGALGYSELGSATEREDVLLLRIDGIAPTLEGADHDAYPFWETEYAYTYGEPEADSLTASFLRYLTNEVGKDIIRSRGHRPCAELQNPVLCRPTA